MRSRIALAVTAAAMMMQGAAAAAAPAECAPAKMVRIVMQQTIPSPPAESFAGMSKTLYRQGAKLGRMEEKANPSTGVKSLIVVDAPDVWMVNLKDKTGRHMLDSSSSPRFRASILMGTDGLPDDLLAFEYGCEIAFMEAAGKIVQHRVQVGEEFFDKYTSESGRFEAALLVDAETGKPRAAGVYKDGELDYLVRYLEYDNALPLDKSLFEKPAGITFSED